MAENTYSIEEFKVIPLSGDLDEFNLREGVITFEYYENILSPSVTAKVIFSASDSIGTKSGDIEIFGGEQVLFEIGVPSFDNLDFTSNGLNVRKISADKTGRQGIYVLELVSGESISNETARVVKRYDKKIEESVKDILTNVLKTSKNVKTDSTFNKYSFIGNTRRPFDVITWLCPKSVPGDNGTPGFFFYETQDGYNFLSANNLLKGGGGTFDTPYIQAENRGNPGDPKNRFKVIESNITKNNDILLSLRLGMYSNNSLFYNIWDNTYEPVKFSLKEDGFGKDQKLATSANVKGKSAAPKLPDGLEDYPSRYLVKALDVGNLTPEGQLETKENLPKYQAVSSVRYSLLYSQVLNIIIPCNTKLRAGQLIECELPKPSSSKNKNTESTASGKYVIASLCHKFDQNRRAFTSLTLIKDSYEYVTT